MVPRTLCVTCGCLGARRRKLGVCTNFSASSPNGPTTCQVRARNVKKLFCFAASVTRTHDESARYSMYWRDSHKKRTVSARNMHIQHICAYVCHTHPCLPHARTTHKMHVNCQLSTPKRRVSCQQSTSKHSPVFYPP